MRRAFYYCWYGDNRHWSEGVVSTPRLGKYDSSDSDVIKQHIQFAKQNDINEYCISWWGIDSYEDKVLMSHLKESFQLENLKISILLETTRYFNAKTEQQYLSVESIQQIVKEVIYLAKNISRVPDSTLDIFIYLSRSITNIHELMRYLNELKIRYPFLRFIGDEVYWFIPSPQDKVRLKLFDSISLYNPHISDEKVIVHFWQNLATLYDKWFSLCKRENLNFIPTILPGFDDSNVRPEARHPVIERDIEQMKRLENQIKKFGCEDCYLCSFNEWHEGTQIEF